MGMDFSGQDLRGRSFKGQDLTGADFSDAQLGGVDFTGATLTHAKFCRARMGHSNGSKSIGVILHAILGGAMGVLVLFSMWFVVNMVKDLLNQLSLSGDAYIIGISALLALVVSVTTWQAIRQQHFNYLLWLFLSIAAPTSIVASTAISVAISAIAIITLVVVVIVAVTVVVAGAATVAAGTSFMIIVVVSIALGASTLSFIPIVAASAITSTIYLLLGMFLGERAIRHEEPQLSLFRHWRLAMNTYGTTLFNGEIRNADFSAANLRFARFAKAHLIGCTWKNAINLHLAQTRGTLLETKKIRTLMATGTSTDHDFSNMDLTGANFAGIDLRDFNFTNTNLNNANFSGCDLSNAILTAANVTGALFNNATLSGACIQNWNIDARTKFKETICTHVYLGANQSERNPPEDDFKEGDFAKLYEQVTDTIDFILHSPDDLDAFIQALARVKADGGDDIYLQNIERKNDSLIVKIKTQEDADHETIAAQLAQLQQEYAKLKQEYAMQSVISENTVLLMGRERDSLYTILLTQAQRPINVTNLHGDIMHDNSRKIAFQNNTLTNAAVNLGDNSTVSNAITQLPETQAELKALLTELSTLIAASKASPADQKDAQHQADIIAEEARQDTPQPGRITRALNGVNAVFGGLEDASGTVEKIADISSKIGGFFGL